MRKVKPIDALLSPVKQDILAATYGEPDRWWYLSEIAANAGRTPSSFQRDLKLLEEAGFLKTKRDGARLYFKADDLSPLYQPLREIVERSIGIADALKSAVDPLKDEIAALFIYGSVARGDERSGSDVDLIAIGNAGLAEMARILRPLEERFKREFNVRCYTGAEFRNKRRSGNHFVNSILTEPKIFIIGSEDDLRGIGG